MKNEHKEHSEHEHGNHVNHEHGSHSGDDHEEHSEHIHGDHSGHGGMDHSMHGADFYKKFIISLFLTIPLVILSPVVQEIFGYSLSFPGSQWVELILASVLYFYCGQPFLKGAYDEIKKRNIGMMTLISVAITVAYFYSVATVFGFEGMNFFWELGTLISIMLLGHHLEMKSIMGASKSLEALAELLPAQALLVDGESTKEINIDEIKKGDILLIRANDKIPADGKIVEGNTSVNESMLTGESKPVKKEQGDQVVGGSINGNNTVKIKVSATGEESYLSNIIGIVEQAQENKSKTQNLADRAAKWLTYIALTAGLLTFTHWLLAGKGTDFSLMMMVGVIIITCPHALGLAIPLVVSNSISKVAQNGVLIRNRTAFEETDKIDTIIFDKTGTLTYGDFKVSKVVSYNDLSEEELLTKVASMEQYSEHPIAQAILKESIERELQLEKVENFESITAKGVKGFIDNEEVMVVSPKAVKDFGHEIKEQSEPGTVVYLLVDKKLEGEVHLADKIRDNAKEAVEKLQKRGIKVLMATGDNDVIAKEVSDKLKLDGFHASLQPEDKVKIVEDLKSKGEFVAMVGDGVNDAPALATADIGFAIGSGTAIANETSDISLINSNPMDVVKSIEWGAITRSKMVQNLVWATAYNVIAIPLAAGILYPHFVLPPAVGAAIMSVSTIIVALNAQHLLTKIK